MKNEQTIAEILLKINAVVLRTNPPFKWSSGILSPIYTDNRLLMGHPKEREVIISSLLKLINNKKIKCDGFAGTATAGIPWAAWLAQRTKKPMAYARTGSKDHGRENKVEGVIQKGKSYVVVEDLISTGSSSINTISAVRDLGGKAENCIAIFTYELEKSRINFKNAKCRLHTLTSFTSLIEAASRKKYINADQKAVIMRWKKNPEAWNP
ncbi:orotate phosphoribosyltransferase [Candidatus Woesearchaeota archaeon]|nr:orotate phosphoribosyltransferase [Candidatus Woesearchaeota archaeon]